MSTFAFLNIPMHGRVNPTLPVVAELVRRGHSVTYHTSPAFREEIEATGATVCLYPGGDQPLPDPPTPVTLMEGLAGSAVRLLPAVLADLRRVRPDVIVHDNACLWAQPPPANSACRRRRRSPRLRSIGMCPAPPAAPGTCWPRRRLGPEASGVTCGRAGRCAAASTRGLPLLDLGNIRQPLNLVYTSRAFQPAVEGFDRSYRFVGPSIGARPVDPSFPADRLKDPVLYASLGTVFNADPQLLRSFATALAPLGGTVIVSTGQTDPAALGPLPANVIARRFVPQPEVLARAALFVTHGGMNSVNEAMYAGVPMLVVPQGADQPMVARRVVELGAGLSVRTQDVARGSVRVLARRLLDDQRFRAAVTTLQVAQHEAGGFRRAADELERYLHTAGSVSQSAPVDPSQRGW